MLLYWLCLRLLVLLWQVILFLLRLSLLLLSLVLSLVHLLLTQARRRLFPPNQCPDLAGFEATLLDGARGLGAVSRWSSAQKPSPELVRVS